ncbi:GIY-YIG nuclease family protein [Ectobacillus funiculus]|uniref:GIY-YIG nuclease family protein n=1 Tax=Ectobacillus funiculus TaxID=137993 RepID=A0ABV5WFU2_9BACI
MMKEAIEELLYTLQILPISNSRWQKFDVCLHSYSINQEYINVKKKIHDCVPKGTSGVYVITKNKKVLYIGESEKNIHTRLKRHMDKIYSRTDSRSEFFKLEEHQGHLSIYYWALPSNLIDKRKDIEDLLTNVLEPEYKKWGLKNKMDLLEKLFREDNDLIQNTDNKHLGYPVNDDFYNELNKDHMLDRLG